ncbi:MAG: aldo/keto reductase [Gammaproteobacteria bacterium]|nr:MAG: aldo/keto reductase [Gammaproteobacteria bacterium]UCH41621.1 MAG: aldo/keto reductase [Gammaproteobacteria bacterium]
MQQRKLGPFTVSAIGLGCMNVSMGYGPRIADDEAGRLFNAALDQGYSFLDTASLYGLGHNESLIGKYLKSRRDEYVLASKCGFSRTEDGKTVMDGRPEVLMQTCEDSLRRLDTEVIDLYYLHRIDPKVPVEESVGALARMVQQGKVRTIGLSEICNDSLRRAHAVHPITAVQSEYSLWTRTPEQKILATCAELGIGFVPFSPLARQFLTGKSPDVTQVDENDIRATIARPRFEPENFAKNSQLLIPFGAIAEREGCSMAQLALAWLLAQGDSIVPIPGTRHADRMIENAGAAAIELSPATVEELDALINEDTVAGYRYTDALMKSTDSEKDWPR